LESVIGCRLYGAGFASLRGGGWPPAGGRVGPWAPGADLLHESALEGGFHQLLLVRQPGPGGVLLHGHPRWERGSWFGRAG